MDDCALPAEMLPIVVRSDTGTFQLTDATSRLLSGFFDGPASYNRFEVQLSYSDGGGEWLSVLAGRNTPGRTEATVRNSNAFAIPLDRDLRAATFLCRGMEPIEFVPADPTRSPPLGDFAASSTSAVSFTLVFDISDLVYYIGHHDNLTGIQRVQASVLLGLVGEFPEQNRMYISFDNRRGDFIVIDSPYFEALIADLSLPVALRTVAFDHMDARVGLLPNARLLAGDLSVGQREQIVVYLLGAAWVNRDYFHRILDLKRQYDARFCMTIHDLIPIFARETCDQGTATVFEEFLRKSFLFVDHYFAVSEYTALDLHRYARSLGRPKLSVSVIENGHSFDEFFPVQKHRSRKVFAGDYVLFVSTIEGRKNHSFMFDVWSELMASGVDVPVLLCIGRLGWRAEQFLEKMLMSGNLDNKIRVMSDVSDSQLEDLYTHSLFTVYPSIYEGWGLPVGESLSKGKLCVCSDKSSIPEVGGNFCLYMDIDSVSETAARMQDIITDAAYRERLEENLRANFVARTWKVVARDLVSKVGQLPAYTPSSFPQVHLGREYKLAQLPPRNFSALGVAMIAEVEGARKALLTGYINRDADLLESQATRFGSSWCSPEDWGTWSRYPECDRLFFVESQSSAKEIILYERLRVVSPLVGYTLRVTVNDGKAQDFRISDEHFLIQVYGSLRHEVGRPAEVRIHYAILGSGDITATLDKIDSRRLGLGFESILILQKDDVSSRLAVIERVLFGGIASNVLPRMQASARSIDASNGRSLLVRSHAGRQHLDSGDERSPSAPLIVLGETVPLHVSGVTGSGEPSEAVLGRGWFPPEASGVWSRGNDATLVFRLPLLSGRAFTMGLEVRCLATKVQPVRLSVAINDVLLRTETIMVSDYQHLWFLVDSSAYADDGCFVVLVHCDRPTTPILNGAGTDDRELGVQIRTLSLDHLLELQPRVRYQLKRDAPLISALAGGWYTIEPSGVWGQAAGARIVASAGASDQPATTARLTVRGRVYGTATGGAAVVNLFAQGEVITSWMFKDDEVYQRTAVVPLTRVGAHNLLDLTFIRVSPLSPAQMGEGEDRRRLGFMLSEVEIEPVDLNDDFEPLTNRPALPLRIGASGEMAMTDTPDVFLVEEAISVERCDLWSGGPRGRAPNVADGPKGHPLPDSLEAPGEVVD